MQVREGSVDTCIRKIMGFGDGDEAGHEAGGCGAIGDEGVDRVESGV